MNSQPEVETRFLQVESGLLEQEHRLTSVLYNFFVLRRSLPTDDPRRAACTRALIWRFFSPQSAAAAGVSLVAILGAVFAWQANQLLARQNDKIDVQNQLTEASRRAALIFELTSINERIDALRRDADEPLTLPKSLTGRIVALSRSLRPYFFLVTPTDEISAFGPAFRGKGKLCGTDESNGRTKTKASFAQWIAPTESPIRVIDRPVSPERGQLLFTLANANLKNFQELIDSGIDFRYADLRGSSLQGISLTSADLQLADFRAANLFRSILENADLSGARFDCASLIGTKFNSARSGSVSMVEARLTRADFTQAFLSDANLSRAFLFGANFERAALERVQLDEAIVCQADEPPGPECTEWLSNLKERAERFDAARWRLEVRKVENHPWADPTSKYLVVVRAAN